MSENTATSYTSQIGRILLFSIRNRKFATMPTQMIRWSIALAGCKKPGIILFHIVMQTEILKPIQTQIRRTLASSR